MVSLMILAGLSSPAQGAGYYANAGVMGACVNLPPPLQNAADIALAAGVPLYVDGVMTESGTLALDANDMLQIRAGTPACVATSIPGPQATIAKIGAAGTPLVTISGNADLRLTRMTVESQTTTPTVGDGGLILLDSLNADLVLENSFVQYGQTLGDGGCIASTNGGSVFMVAPGISKVQGCFAGGDGGGLFLSGGIHDFLLGEIAWNYAGNDGGGLFVEGSAILTTTGSDVAMIDLESRGLPR